MKEDIFLIEEITNGLSFMIYDMKIRGSQMKFSFVLIISNSLNYKRL